MIRLILLFACLVSSAFGRDLVLPPVIYAVPDVPVKIVFRNAALIAPGEKISFSCDCKIGKVVDGESWELIAKPSDVGDHILILKSGNRQASSTIRVVKKNAGAGEKLSLLIVGDSLTNSSRYPNEVGRLLSLPGNPDWKMLGTHQPGSVADRVAHEGYGGWTWKRFNTRWAPNSNQVGKRRSSPFLFLENGEPVVNIERYYQELCAGEKPDYVTFLLGINDCFHPDPEDPKAIEAKIESMMVEAEKLLAAFRKASPDADIGLCLTPAANDRDKAFYANYKDRYTRWGWRRIQFRLVERQLEQFGNREDENIFIIPTSVGIDPIKGYPADNGVHPSLVGYQTIGREIYSWLKSRMEENAN